MTALKIKGIRGEEYKSSSSRTGVSKKQKDPVVKEGLKGLLGLFKAFVVVGGDFV